MKVNLDKKGISVIEKHLRHKVRDLQRKTAEAAASYLINFGYHSIYPSGPNRENGPGWSYYYAANWNCSVGSPDCNYITPERHPFKEQEGAYGDELTGLDYVLHEGPFRESGFDDVLYVVNPVYYGKWLNDGGILNFTHTVTAHPNRFMELCEDHLKNIMPTLIRQVREER